MTFAAEHTPQTFLLPNGLKIVVKPVHRSPVVVSQLCYRVGSGDEPPPLTGIAHALEHLMFKGTKQYKPGEFSKKIAAEGGNDNAYTSFDYTCYFQQLAADRLSVALALEADRMQNLQLIEPEFRQEIEVVKEERRMRIDNQPEGVLSERFRTMAHFETGYAHPIIGWMTNLNHFQLKDALDWYHQWYAPENAVLIVVGDVEPAAVLTMARRYFGAIPRHSAIPPVRPQWSEPFYAMRSVTVQVPAQLPYLMYGYNTPSLKTATQAWEVYALEVTAELLSGGDSSRLPKALVRDQNVATDVSAGFDLYARMPGLFTVTAVLAPGKPMPELKHALIAQINSLKTSLVSPVELARVKNRLATQKTYSRDSLFYQAMQIGSLESVGLSWQDDAAYLDRINQVTPAQIQQVARKYLIDDRLTIAVLEPTTPTTTQERTHVH